MSKKAHRKAVYSIRDGNDDKSYWNRVGVAFVNSDGSLNVVLDSIPINGRLHIREFGSKSNDSV
jgi:hypothetical protein